MKTNQKGRSMVEMLGVLAIIGVLSAGGLAGYSKAMKQHKMNTFLNQMVRLQEQISEKFLQVQSENTLKNLDLIPLGVFDGFKVNSHATECEVWNSTGTGTVMSAIGGCVLVEVLGRTDSASLDYDYVLDIDLGKGEQGQEFCLWFLMNYSWEGLSGIDSSSGFGLDGLANITSITDMCHQCAYDYDGCWFDTYWKF